MAAALQVAAWALVWQAMHVQCLCMQSGQGDGDAHSAATEPVTGRT